MPGPLTAEFPGQSAKLRAGHAGGVVDDRNRGVRALAGKAPRLQGGDELVGVGYPQLDQAAQVGAVGVKEQPHPFLYRQLRGRDPVRRGLDLSRQPAFRFLRGPQLPFACRGLLKQLAQLCDGLRLPLGDGLGVAPGPGENVCGRCLGGLQVGSFPGRRRSVPISGIPPASPWSAAPWSAAPNATTAARWGLSQLRVGRRGRRLVQRRGELVTSGPGLMRGLGRLGGVPRDVAGLPVPVCLLDPRRVLLAAASSRRCSSRSASRIAGSASSAFWRASSPVRRSSSSR